MSELVNTIQKVAIYGRVSTEEQAEGKNIDSQIEELRKYAVEKGHEVVREFKDEGWSGGLLARPALDELRDDATKGMFEAVLINDVDRLARDVAHIGVIKRDLENKGVRIIFRKLPNGNGPMDNLMINVLGSFAEFERAIIADRLRRGKIHKVKVRGQFLGHIPAYGYDYIHLNKNTREQGVLKINENENKIVKMIFHWVGHENISGREVVRRLTEMKIPTRKGKNIWGKSTVLRILKNENYLGHFFYNRVESVLTDKHHSVEKYRKNLKTGRRFRPRSEWINLRLPHLRIIDDETFLAVQNQLKKNLIFSKRNTKAEYLLGGGMLKCGKCGSSYYGNTNGNQRFYRDGNRWLRFPFRKNCNSPSISVNKIEPLVWNEISQLFSRPSFLIKQLEKNKDLLENQPNNSDELNILENRLNALKTEEERLISGYQKGIFNDEDIKNHLTNIKNDKIAIIDKINISKNQGDNSSGNKIIPKDLKILCSLIRKKLPKLDFEEKQKLFRLLVKEVIFDGKIIKIRGFIPIPNNSKNDMGKRGKTPFFDKNALKSIVTNIILLYYDCRWRRFLKLF